MTVSLLTRSNELSSLVSGSPMDNFRNCVFFIIVLNFLLFNSIKNLPHNHKTNKFSISQYVECDKSRRCMCIFFLNKQYEVIIS